MLEKRRDWSPSGYLLFEIRQSEWPPIDRNLHDLVPGFQLSALLEYNNYRKLTRGKKKRIFRGADYPGCGIAIPPSSATRYLSFKRKPKVT